uniref:Uncharacterized protein n=1 Tax=Ralstonia solanacearum CFBP2957 TaxID=859656 RepID=D8P5F2_RALSL|nr:protein of unknown function [Ralstonia solanacearum CFBP2957]
MPIAYCLLPIAYCLFGAQVIPVLNRMPRVLRLPDASGRVAPRLRAMRLTPSALRVVRFVVNCRVRRPDLP